MKRLLLHLLAACFWLFATTSANVHAADEVRQRFLWDQATTLLRHAHSDKDFLRVAEVYRDLIESGVRNETVFYNYGTALLLANSYEEATIALTRAERYGGTTPEIERNLRLAAAAGKPVEEAVLPWYRIPLWWHFGLSARSRIAVTAILFATFWLALILRSTGWRRAVAPFFAASIAGLVIFASSSAVSVYQEWRDRATPEPTAQTTPQVKP